jgi:hypothetical protein
MVNFQTGNPNLGKFWRVGNVDICFHHSEYFTDIWDSLIPLSAFYVYLIFFSVLVSRTKKNLATLDGMGTNVGRLSEAIR